MIVVLCMCCRLFVRVCLLLCVSGWDCMCGCLCVFDVYLRLVVCCCLFVGCLFVCLFVCLVVCVCLCVVVSACL